MLALRRFVAVLLVVAHVIALAGLGDWHDVGALLPHADGPVQSAGVGGADGGGATARCQHGCLGHASTHLLAAHSVAADLATSIAAATPHLYLSPILSSRLRDRPERVPIPPQS